MLIVVTEMFGLFLKLHDCNKGLANEKTKNFAHTLQESETKQQSTIYLNIILLNSVCLTPLLNVFFFY